MTEVALIGPGNLGRTIAAAMPEDRCLLEWIHSSSWVSARKAARELRRGRPARRLREGASADCWLTTVPVELAESVLSDLVDSVELTGKHVMYVAAESAPRIERMLSRAGAISVAMFPMTLLNRPGADFGGARCLLAGSQAGVRFGRRFVAQMGGAPCAVEPERLALAAEAHRLLAGTLSVLLDRAADRLSDAGVPRRTAAQTIESLGRLILADAAKSARFRRNNADVDDAVRWARELLDSDAAAAHRGNGRGARAASASRRRPSAEGRSEPGGLAGA